MAEYRVPSTTKVNGLIATHAATPHGGVDQAALDAAVATHAALEDEHHLAFDQADHDALANPHHDSSGDHVAPTYDGGTDEVVFQI